jgi:uncharacterized protein (TIGR02145 family)
VSVIVTGCKKDEVQLAKLKTLKVTHITSTSAVCGGSIISDGHSSIIQRGMDWSDNIDSLKTGTFENYFEPTDTFTFSMGGLTPGRTYYVRPFIKNSSGITYGDIVTFTTQSTANNNMVFNSGLSYGSVVDFDGNVYKTIIIGSQTWMAENYRAKHYLNGTAISEYRVNKHDSLNVKPYGLFYSFGPIHYSNFAPKGWHVPTVDDWNKLISYLSANGYNYDLTLTGNKVAKSLATTIDWAYDSTVGNIGNDISANNKSGFSALPCGMSYLSSGLTDLGYQAGWWTNDPKFLYIIGSNSEELYQVVDGSNNYYYTVRCIKD